MNVAETSSDIPQSIGKFNVIRHLGEGGMGEVFLCDNPKWTESTSSRGLNVPKVLAVKTLSPELLQDESILKRFEAEALALSPIQHRNVVRLYEWGKIESGEGAGQHFIAMEYVAGISLHQLARLRRLSFPDVLDIAIQISEGLEAIHNSGVVHRDLKPANIMITHDGVAKIIDFGIAKVGDGISGSDARGFKTKTGMIVGTVNYLGPEILAGASASTRSDIYALGLVIWEVLNGVTPFKSGSLSETMKRVMDEAPVWAGSMIDIAPPGFLKLMNSVTSKDISKRPQTAEEFTARLRKIRAEATWPGIFNRRARLDLDIKWSSDLLGRMKDRAVPSEDFMFVLQNIEDRLIREGDERINGNTSLDVEDSVLEEAMNAFKSGRYEAAMARQARLRADLQSAGANGEKTTPSGVRSLPKNRRNSLDGTPTPHSRSSSVSATSDQSRMRVIGIGVAAILITAAIVFGAVGFGRKKINQMSESSVIAEVPVYNNLAEVQKIQTLISDLKLNLRVVYDVQMSTISGSFINTQETRHLKEMNDGKLTWDLDAGARATSPIAFFPVEMFFNPLNRNLGDPSAETASATDLFPLRIGRSSNWTVTDTKSGNSEQTTCTPLSKSDLAGVEVWQIECVRVARTAEGRDTHRSLETYEYRSKLGVFSRYSIKTDILTASGGVARTETRSAAINRELSDLSPR